MRGIVLALLVACGATMTLPSNDRGDPTEWQLLHDAVTAGALGQLAEYYQQHERWDEMSAVRARMLAAVPPGPGPAPGGPFPRIGLPNPHAGVSTVLARWLNRTELPELYEEPQVSQDELIARLRALPASHATDVKLAAALCSELAFAEAEALYERMLAAYDDPALRARHADIRRILGR